MNELIPTLNLNHFKSPYKKNQDFFVAGLKHALETTGFFFLQNHGISEETLLKSRAVFDAFFSGDIDREKYEFKEEQHQRGYTPMRLEKGEFATIADEKHFFQIGNDRMVEVEEIPDFKATTTKLYHEFRDCSLVLLQAIGRSLALEEEYFSNREGNSIMRAIDYPATENPLEDDEEPTLGGNIAGMCASKHTDINMITLLEAKEVGLQLFYNNHWIPVTIADSNLIIVNAGDMLEHLTGGRYKSGLHRVVCTRNIRRFSIPYFCHLNTSESVAPLKQLGLSDLVKYPYKTVGQYLDFRLAQIGL